MTSSASTGRCPSFISPPPPSNGSRADPGSACGGPLDPETGQVLGQALGILELATDAVPAPGSPDLGVVARPDDHGLAVQLGPLAEVRRDQDPTGAVELGLDGAAEEE